MISLTTIPTNTGSVRILALLYGQICERCCEGLDSDISKLMCLNSGETKHPSVQLHSCGEHASACKKCRSESLLPLQRKYWRSLAYPKIQKTQPP
jgi:hypothetical protein